MTVLTTISQLLDSDEFITLDDLSSADANVRTAAAGVLANGNLASDLESIFNLFPAEETVQLVAPVPQPAAPMVQGAASTVQSVEAGGLPETASAYISQAAVDDFDPYDSQETPETTPECIPQTDAGVFVPSELPETARAYTPETDLGDFIPHDLPEVSADGPESPVIILPDKEMLRTEAARHIATTLPRDAVIVEIPKLDAVSEDLMKIKRETFQAKKTLSKAGSITVIALIVAAEIILIMYLLNQ